MNSTQLRARRPQAALLVLTLAGLGLGGCVNQDSYDQLRSANDALKARNQELTEQVQALEAARQQLLDRYRSGDLSLDQARQLIAQLESQLRDRDAKLADLNKRLENLAVGPVDEATDAALQRLAEQFPGILSYDAAKGMIRFESDLTFASGSFELTSEARRSIDALAKLMRDLPTAQQYELRVIGHTDTQRVRSAAGRRFQDNLELSAFRALSVRSELVNGGLMPNKVEFGGWGEFRPAVPNNPSGNTQQNRRVEVYLVKSTWDKPMPTLPAARVAPPSTARTTTGTTPAPAATGTAAPAGTSPDIMR
ncbi:MAG: OmpA family protein [Planctomycetaceae bacterium]|nr:OmpA family protein [Phycisphaerales bacterium]MCE2653160.1 OmpA family protein [Planctomycetaceae bacterium]